MQLISIGQFHKVIEKYLYWLSLPSIGFTDILEIIIISVIVYQMLKWVQLTRAWTLFKGIIMLLLFALFAAIFQLNTISWLLSNSLSVGITAAIIIFQPELRRALEQLGRKKIFSNIFSFSAGEYEGRQSAFTEKTINEVVRASYEMGEVKTGALIVIEQNVALGEYVRTGISIDGLVTSQLLINIFEHNTPLHDGAVIIRGNRIVSATYEGGGHDINVPPFEEDKVAGRFYGNVLLERKVQTVFAGSTLKGLDVAVRHFDVGDGGVLAHQMLDGLLAAIGFGLLHLLLRLLDLLNELVQRLFQHLG